MPMEARNPSIAGLPCWQANTPRLAGRTAIKGTLRGGARLSRAAGLEGLKHLG